MQAFAPNGKQIIGTYEMCPARAEISLNSFGRDTDGTVSFDYAGESEMFWDGMETVTKEGKIVFLDGDGNEWTEDQIELREEVAHAH
jgi:hypothetical protein